MSIYFKVLGTQLEFHDDLKNTMSYLANFKPLTIKCTKL